MSMVSFQAALPAGMDQAGTSVELFTGAGGLALGMHRAGYRHLALNENNAFACETLRNNSRALGGGDSLPLIPTDIEIVDFRTLAGRVDVVAGGPPCQPFSIAGNALGDQDERNGFPWLFRAIREIRPRAVLCESVVGLLRPSFDPYFQYILRELRAPFIRRKRSEAWFDHDIRLVKALRSRRSFDQSERYDVYCHAVDAANYGVPQLRKRVLIVAFRKDLAACWKLPRPTHSENMLQLAQTSGAYWLEHGLEPSEASISPLPIEEKVGRWATLRDAIRGLGEPGADKAETAPHLHHMRWPGARSYRGHLPNNLDSPAKTIKAGVHGVAGGENVVRLDDGSIRYLTVREVARIMTFPDDWLISGPRSQQMRQLGNAVPPRLAEVFATAVRNQLSLIRPRTAAAVQ